MSLISYGFVLVNPRTEILLGHVTGQDCWDIPKGGADPGEQPLAAALRELQEETSIVLKEHPVELGLCAYTKRKKLHLFTAKVGLDAYPAESLTCLSYFTHPYSKLQLPEIDAFKWCPLSRIGEFCTPALTATLLALPIWEPTTAS